jgi:hypothetical protein
MLLSNRVSVDYLSLLLSHYNILRYEESKDETEDSVDNYYDERDPNRQ